MFLTDIFSVFVPVAINERFSNYLNHVIPDAETSKGTKAQEVCLVGILPA